MKYEYNAKCVSIYDGDTITVDIDLGFGLWRTGEKLRLFGIDTPEVRGVSRETGLVSRDELREKILGKDIVVQTIRDSKGKYGRYLATVFFNDENINDWLVFNDLAIYREY